MSLHYPNLYTPIFRRDVLWYGDVHPGLRTSMDPSDFSSGSLSVCFSRFLPKCFDILSCNSAYDYLLMYCRASLSVVTFYQFGECHCLWTSEYPKAHGAKFYGRLWLIFSVLGASTFFVLKLIEIVILWVYYTIPFGFSLFLHFPTTIFNF